MAQVTVGVLCAAVVAAACGGPSGGGDAPGGLDASTAGSPPSPLSGAPTTNPTTGRTTGTAATPTSAASAFPVRVTRSGGIAGFDDRVTVLADGVVTATSSRATVPRRCRLDPASLDRLSAAVLAADWAASSPPTLDPRMADQMVTSVSSALGGPAAISDPALGSLRRLASELLVVTGGDAGTSLQCVRLP